MRSEDPAKGEANARDSAQRDHDALRQSIDAAWSRLIHTSENTDAGSATTADEKSAERYEGIDDHRDTTPPRSW